MEMVGWLFIVIFSTFGYVLIGLFKNIKFKHVYGIVFFGFLFGSIMLYYSRDYGLFAFSFLIFWIIRLFILFIPLIIFKKSFPTNVLLLLEYGFPIVAIFLGLYFQTAIWFIASTLMVLPIILSYYVGIFIKPQNSESDNETEILFKSLPLYLIPLTSVFFIFNIGIIDSTTLQSFYSTLIQGIFTLLGLVATFGSFFLEKIKSKEKSNLFMGLILIYILIALVLIYGLISYPKNSQNALDLSNNVLFPNSPLKERQLPNNIQIFEEIKFSLSLSLLVFSFGYLYKYISDIRNINDK